jgi:mannosidase alpha-like ER degradation enhancer 3
MKAINKFSRTKCGFAAVKDVRTGSQEDRMDSFVLAETFKYLYLLFAEESDLIINLEDFIFTTEAHLLPLSLSVISLNNSSSKSPVSASVLLPTLQTGDDSDQGVPEKQLSTCPSNKFLMKSSYSEYQSFQEVRASLKGFVESSQRKSSSFFGSSSSSCPSQVQHVKLRKQKGEVTITAAEFSASNPVHLDAIRRMGIQAILLADGKIQLIQSAASAASLEDAEEGIQFMQDMIDLTKQQTFKTEQELRSIQFSSPKTGIKMNLAAGPALFGPDINERGYGASATALVVDPISGCDFKAISEETKRSLKDRIAITKRGDCMFVNKARNVEKLGAVGMIVLDNNPDSSASVTNMFSMSGDGTNDIQIPVLFLYGQEAATLMDVLKDYSDIIVHMMPGTSSSPKTNTHSTETKKKMSIEEKLEPLLKDPGTKKKHGIISQIDKIAKLQKHLNPLMKKELVASLKKIQKGNADDLRKLLEVQGLRVEETLLENIKKILMSSVVQKFFEQVDDDDSVFMKARQLLESLGLIDDVVQRRQMTTCLNPRNNPKLFLSFISSNQLRRRVSRRG